MSSVAFGDIEAAAAALRNVVVRTPCAPSQTLSSITGANVWCKYENLQYTASFKERGARWFLEAIPAEARALGVVAASAGNHAQGLAHHSQLLGIDATIVMPTGTPFTKVSRTEMSGATVVLFGANFTEAHARAQALAVERAATFVPAFDDARIIAGQGTVAIEMLEQQPALDTLIIPVGGGGLIAGCAIAAKHINPSIRVIGVQVASYPAMANALHSSSGSERSQGIGGATIAEGIAVAQPGILTTEIVREIVDDIVIVDEQTIEEAVALFVEIEKTVVEGAGAAGLAALLDHGPEFAGRNCGVVVSGGNIDLRVLSSVILRALARTGRIVRYRLEIPDRPGVLAAVSTIIGGSGGNIIDVEHHRDRPGVPLRETVLEVSVETRDRAHADRIAQQLNRDGFVVTNQSL